jgi:hypothetical protein
MNRDSRSIKTQDTSSEAGARGKEVWGRGREFQKPSNLETQENESERWKKLRQRATTRCTELFFLSSLSILSFLIRLGLVQEGPAGYTKRRIVARRSKPSFAVVRGVQCAS